MLQNLKWLLTVCLLAVLFSSCGILSTSPDIVNEPVEIITTAPPTQEATAVAELPTVTPEPVPSQEAIPSVIDAGTVENLTIKIQLPFENPVAASWAEAGDTYVVFSNDGLKSYTVNNLSPVNTARFDNSAQFLDVSPDGTLIAQTRDMETLEIINTATSQMEKRINPQTMVNSAHFSPDGSRILITSMDEAIALEYDLRTDKLMGSYTGFEFAGPVYDVDYSPFSNDLIWISRGSAMVQNLSTHAVSQMFYHEDFINSITLSSDGSTLVVSTAKTQNGTFGAGIQFWNRNNGMDLGFINTTSIPKGLVFTPDGSLLLGADGATLCAWDSYSHALTQSFVGHTELISFVSLSPDGRRLLTGAFDNTVILWTIP